MILYVGCTNGFTVRGFRDKQITPKADSYLNAASVATWSLSTAIAGGGSVVDSGTLTYITASNGTYHFDIPSTVSIVAGTVYYLTVTLTQTSNGSPVTLAFKDVAVTAQNRTGLTPNS